MKCVIGEQTRKVCCPPETNIIYRSKCNMSIYIIIGGYIIKIEIWFT